MYAKCVALETALHLFLKSPEKHMVSLNVITGALALHGFGLKAIGMFEEMQVGGIWPDKFTFSGLLSACSHSGLVDIGDITSNRVSPELEHFACMVDLSGRVGLLEETIRLIVGMQLSLKLLFKVLCLVLVGFMQCRDWKANSETAVGVGAT